MATVIELPLVGITETMDALLDSPRFQAWIENDHVKFYVRSGYHMIEHQPKRCVDLVNITVNQPGRGTFTRFLEFVERQTKLKRPENVVYVENVQDARFEKFLASKGYKRQHSIADQDGFPSYWKQP